MPVTTVPPATEAAPDGELERRVADLEALIEEARRRARRRRRRNGAAALLVAVGIAALIGFGNHDGGGGSASSARTRGPQGSPAKGESQPLAALPAEAGIAKSFAFDPRNPDIVYVLTVGFSNGTGRSHVFKTTDGGAHWQMTATSGSDWVGLDEALAADPRHPGTLYAGTEHAVYKTVDGGDTWRRSARGLLAPPGSTYTFNRDKGWVVALAVDPASPNIVFAGSDRVGKSTDAGQSWRTVFPPHATRYPPENVSALAIAPTHPEAIYAISGHYPNPSPIPAGGRTSIYKSTDAGTTWHATTAVRGSVHPTALVVDPRHPTTVYAAIGAKVLKTTNAGETWQPIANGLPISATRGTCRCLSQGSVRALAVDPRGTGIVYAALTQGGIFKSSNGGQAWYPALGAPLFFMYAVAVDPARPATIYAAGVSETGTGPRILRSIDGGRTWKTAG